MEKKLEEYRLRKRKEHTEQMVQEVQNLIAPEESAPLSSPQENDLATDKLEVSSSLASDPRSDRTNIFIYVISAVFWVTVYGIAIHMEFGTVYLVVSMLFFIWKNTRTGPKQQNEISAYSVFNPNCEEIDGTLNAEQFEREIRYGPGSVH